MSSPTGSWPPSLKGVEFHRPLIVAYCLPKAVSRGLDVVNESILLRTFGAMAVVFSCVAEFGLELWNPNWGHG